MSKRLQVPLPDQETAGIQQLASREGLSVGEWVRRELREVRANTPSGDPDVKLEAIRSGAEMSFPTADMEQMLGEIEQGYHD